MMKPGIRAAFALTLVAGSAGLIGYIYKSFYAGPAQLPAVSDCALHQASCSTPLPRGGRVSLDIEPKQPAPTDPLRVYASFQDLNPDFVGLRFRGIDMNMGYLEHYVHELARTRGDATGSAFSGTAGVFACSMSRMRWQVFLRFDIDGSIYEIPFEFETLQKTDPET